MYDIELRSLCSLKVIIVEEKIYRFDIYCMSLAGQIADRQIADADRACLGTKKSLRCARFFGCAHFALN